MVQALVVLAQDAQAPTFRDPVAWIAATLALGLLGLLSFIAKAAAREIVDAIKELTRTFNEDRRIERQAHTEGLNRLHERVDSLTRGDGCRYGRHGVRGVLPPEPPPRDPPTTGPTFVPLRP